MSLLNPDADAVCDAQRQRRQPRHAGWHLRGVSFLLTGDIEAAGEDMLIRSGACSQYSLEASHHGSKTSDLARIPRTSDPLIVVISAGAGNPFGHPSPETLVRLADRRVFRTDQSGTVEIATDGTRLWVNVDR